MMFRKPVAVHWERFDFEAAKPEVEEIAHHFGAYLSSYRDKEGGRSRHATMGPVGKLLQQVRTGEWGLEDLLGFAVRTHEMSDATGYLSPEAHNQLRAGIEKLLDLLQRAPLTARPTLLSRVEYATYYQQKLRLLEYLQGVMGDWAAFLRAKYGDDQALRQAWSDPRVSFERLPYPSEKALAGATGAKREDIAAFLAEKGKEVAEIVEEIEEEE